MKYSICLTPIFFFMATLITWAQPGGYLSKETRERIEAQRVAYITQQLDLTPDEAAKFWPIYNEYKDALKDMRDDFERPDFESMTDDEANALIEKHLKQEEHKLALKRTLLTKLSKVVSPTKVVMLQKVEMEFNRELLRKAQEHKKQ
jgi:hypothetical protein